MADSSRKWLLIGQKHVRVLEDYADALESRNEHLPCSPRSGARIARLRALARRIKLFVEAGQGGFSVADARLLSEIAEELERERSSLGERPYLAPEPVRFRLGLGMEIRGVERRIRQFTRI